MPMFKRSMSILLTTAVLLITGTALMITARDEGVEISVPEEKSSVSMVTVYVSGAVRKPGVIMLPRGERVISAVKKCGDVLPTADTDAINMAEMISDGMHINIPEVSGAVSGAVRIGQQPDKININRADEKALDSLPGIGPAMAKRIIDYRTEKGKFKVIDDLKKVRGIGDAKFEKLRDRITV